ncbi:MAG: hypothetical protein QW371_06075 [Candidatus Bathyarchaeia archaeon]
MKIVYELKDKEYPILIGLAIFSALAHLFFILIYPISYDLKIWITVGNALASGKNFYCEALASNTIFGYPPLFAQIFIFPLVLLIHPSNEFAFLLALRLVFLVFDLGTGILLWKILGSKRLLAALWFLNPFIMGIAQYQFDSIPAFFILLAFYALRKNAFLSSWLLGIAASLKTYPALLLPIAVKRAGSIREIAIASLVALSIPLLSTMSFLKSECFWRLTFIHFDLASQLMRRYVFPVVYIIILIFAYKKGLDPISTGISILSLFHLFYTYSVYPFPPVQYSVSLLPLLIFDMSKPGSRLEKYLAYNSVWIFALAARYKATIYKHIPMPIPFETFGQLSFYGFMASLAAACAVALLESFRARDPGTF